MQARCCWCNSGFVKIGDHFWCQSEPCRQRQAEHSVYVQNPSTGEFIYLYVPLPRQVDFDACTARYLLGGGAAGSTKSHSARWSMYRRALNIPDYEGLLLRETWDELNKHHFRLMAREADDKFQKYGFDVNFSITNREMVFNVNGNKRIIEGGHMEDPKDIRKYLSRERDEIVADEGSLFPPKPLLELSTRARSTKPGMRKLGLRGLFRVYTNPGGPSSPMLRDLFKDHNPNWEDFAPKFREDYNPDEWVYIPGALEDNPYMDEDYERDLSLLEPWRYEQLRHNDWDIVAGLFFGQFKASVHVKDLDIDRSTADIDWFRSMDWGYVNPGCFGWFGCLPDGIIYVRRDMKFVETGIPEVVERVFNIDRELGLKKKHERSRVRYTVADTSIFGTYGGATDSFKGETIDETFRKCGIPMIKADRDREGGWLRVRENLRLRPDGRPTLIIHPDCRYTIRTMAAAVSSPTNPEDVNTHLDDHAIDMLRYGLMSRPAPTRRATPVSARSFQSIRKRMVAQRRQLTIR